MNKTRFTIRLSILLGLTLSILSGCANEQQTAAKPVYPSNAPAASNATNNPQLEKISGDHSRWIGDKLKSGNYKHLIIEAVVINPLPEDLTSDQQKRLDSLLTAFDQILLAKLSTKVSIVNEPGIGIARLQPTFTSVSSSMRGMKAYEVIPLAALIGGIKAATGTRGKEVDLWLESTVVDSQTDELLTRMVRKGSADQADRNQATVEDVRELLQEWAKEGAASAAKLFN